MRDNRHLLSMIAAGCWPAWPASCLASLRCRTSVERFHFSICNAHHLAAGESALNQQKDFGLERAYWQNPGKGSLIEGVRT